MTNNTSNQNQANQVNQGKSKMSMKEIVYKFEDLAQEKYEENPLTELEAFLLGLKPNSENHDKFVDYKNIYGQLNNYHPSSTTIAVQLYAILEFYQILKDQNIPLVSNQIRLALSENKVYSEDPFVSMSLDLEYPEVDELTSGDIVIGQIRGLNNERRLQLVEQGVNFIETCDLFKSQIVNVPKEIWVQYFNKIAIDQDETTWQIVSTGMSIHLNKEDFSVVEPNFIARNSYTLLLQGYVHHLLDGTNGWCNYIFTLIRNGMTRKKFGAAMRRDATNAVVPVQHYGLKSSFNLVGESNKHGILDLNVNISPNKGCEFEIKNPSNMRVVGDVFQSLPYNAFAQHQGEYLKTEEAAYASFISLLKYKDMNFYLFNRSVDKITKVLNRCSLLNRTGTMGKKLNEEITLSEVLSEVGNPTEAAAPNKPVNKNKLALFGIAEKLDTVNSFAGTKKLVGNLENWELFNDYYAIPKASKKSLNNELVTLKKLLAEIVNNYDRENNVMSGSWTSPAAAFTHEEMCNNLHQTINNYKMSGVPQTFGLMSATIFFYRFVSSSSILRNKLKASKIKASSIINALAVTSLGMYESGPLGGMNPDILEFLGNWTHYIRWNQYEGEYASIYEEWKTVFVGDYQEKVVSEDTFKFITFVFSLLNIGKLSEQSNLNDNVAPYLINYSYGAFDATDCYQLGQMLLLMRRAAQGAGAYYENEERADENDLISSTNFIDRSWVAQTFKGSNFMSDYIRYIFKFQEDFKLLKNNRIYLNDL